jgi:AcrR family transcriptional regulator
MPKVSDAHLAARRRQILDAAARCFARDGFHRTSMQDIVRESGISAGLVYRYFAGKDDMINAIVTEWHDQRQTMLATAPTVEQAAEGYLDLLASIGRPEARDPLRLGVQIWAEAVRSPHIRDLARRNVDDPRAQVADLIRRATTTATARKADPTAARSETADPLNQDPDALARVLISIYQGLLLQTAWDETVDNDAYVKVVRSLLDALDLTQPG